MKTYVIDKHMSFLTFVRVWINLSIDLMKTKETIQADILSLTMKIENEFPELSKYIAEMPHKIPHMDTVQIGTKNFEDYYN